MISIEQKKMRFIYFDKPCPCTKGSRKKSSFFTGPATEPKKLSDFNTAPPPRGLVWMYSLVD